MKIPRLYRTAFRADSFADADPYYRSCWYAATPTEHQ